MSSEDYRQKYLKYKTKYVQLKNSLSDEQYGGHPDDQDVFIIFTDEKTVKKITNKCFGEDKTSCSMIDISKLAEMQFTNTYVCKIGQGGLFVHNTLGSSHTELRKYNKPKLENFNGFFNILLPSVKKMLSKKIDYTYIHQPNDHIIKNFQNIYKLNNELTHAILCMHEFGSVLIFEIYKINPEEKVSTIFTVTNDDDHRKEALSNIKTELHNKDPVPPKETVRGYLAKSISNAVTNTAKKASKVVSKVSGQINQNLGNSNTKNNNSTDGRNKLETDL